MWRHASRHSQPGELCSDVVTLKCAASVTRHTRDENLPLAAHRVPTAQPHGRCPLVPITDRVQLPTANYAVRFAPWRHVAHANICTNSINAVGPPRVELLQRLLNNFSPRSVHRFSGDRQAQTPLCSGRYPRLYASDPRKRFLSNVHFVKQFWTETIKSQLKPRWVGKVRVRPRIWRLQ
jgi:hypothetical protein